MGQRLKGNWRRDCPVAGPRKFGVLRETGPGEIAPASQRGLQATCTGRTALLDSTA